MIWQIVLGLASILYAYWFYQVVIGMRGLAFESAPPRVPRRLRFAIVVPARNEEAVIGHLLDSVMAQDYPRDLRDVYVVADACVDRTEAISEELGASVLSWRGEPMGKTRNLGWAFEQIALERYDAIAVFDADNLVTRQWLTNMSDYLTAHPEAEIVQGYLESKNPRDSWITRVYTLQYWYLNRFWSLARSRCGLSVNVGGTGYVMRTALMRKLGWRMESLTEDLELTCAVVLAGGRVHWNEAAITYDEKPVSGTASRQQRARWLQGHYWLARRYAPAALERLVNTGRFQYADLLLHLIVPGRSAVSYAPMFVGLIVPALGFVLDPSSSSSGAAYLSVTLAVCAIAQIALLLVVAPSLRQRRFTLRYLPDAMSFLLYGIWWVPVAGRAVARSWDQSVWVKTEHTKAVGLADVAHPVGRDAS